MKFEPIDLSASSHGTVPTAPEPGLHLFVENPRVEELPECGEITFRFVRGPVTQIEALRGMPARANVDLTLTEVCKVKACEPEESDEKKDEIDELFNEVSQEEEKE